MKFFLSKTKNFLLLLMRFGLAGTFFWSAVHHLRDPLAFVIKVSEYEVLPARLVEPFAMVLPWAMMVSSGLLVIGLFTRPASGVQALMLVSFIAAVGINIFRDKVMGCGCFSEEGSQIGWPLLVQDLSFLLLAVILILQGGGAWSFDRWFYRLLFRDKEFNRES